jgi:hypothetical protein
MSEKTVGCESCHGAGSAHIDFVKSAKEHNVNLIERYF